MIRAYVFLAGLNRNLDEVCGRILGRKPFPSIREVFSEVRREEARQKMMLNKFNAGANTEDEASAFASRGSNTEEEKRKNHGVIKAKNHGMPTKHVGKFMESQQT